MNDVSCLSVLFFLLQHCHVYEHAERGMLGFIVINGGYGPSGGPGSPERDPHCTTGIRSDNTCCLQSCGRYYYYCKTATSNNRTDYDQTKAWMSTTLFDCS